MKKICVLTVVLMALTLAMPLSSFAAGAQDELDYPELVVTPRASDRLDMEAKKEASRKWTNYSAFQVSALSTFAAGLLYSAKPDTATSNNGSMKLAGLFVGGGWIAATVALSTMYSPYQKAAAEVSPLPKGSTREKLTRERLAEESIDQAATLARRLTWLSVLTNLGANGAMLSKVDTGSFSLVLCGMGAVAAFAPVIFESHWSVVANEQHEYKKKIYAPVARFMVLPNPSDGTPVGNFTLSLNF